MCLVNSNLCVAVIPSESLYLLAWILECCCTWLHNQAEYCSRQWERKLVSSEIMPGRDACLLYLSWLLRRLFRVHQNCHFWLSPSKAFSVCKAFAYGQDGLEHSSIMTLPDHVFPWTLLFFRRCSFSGFVWTQRTWPWHPVLLLMCFSVLLGAMIQVLLESPHAPFLWLRICEVEFPTKMHCLWAMITRCGPSWGS